MEIEKKTWPRYFQEILDGRKKFEIRLADFEVNEGDILILREFDPVKKEYTGRVLKKKINFVTEFNPINAHGIDEIQEKGFYGIGLSEENEFEGLENIKEISFELLENINEKFNIEHVPDSIFLHLAEEVGEVARELSKKQKNWREDFSKEKLGEELADVINSVLIIAKDNGINMEEAYKNKYEKVKKRFEVE